MKLITDNEVAIIKKQNQLIKIFKDGGFSIISLKVRHNTIFTKDILMKNQLNKDGDINIFSEGNTFYLMENFKGNIIQLKCDIINDFTYESILIGISFLIKASIEKMELSEIPQYIKNLLTK